MALARRLGARGIEVISVASGADALRKLQDVRPDVVFMDYMMPEMDGLECCSAIVNNSSTSDIPVIMTTSNDTPEFRKRGVSSGASGFLSKGLEDRELDNVLDGVSGAKIDQRAAGGAMATGISELSAETLALIRDQAINAARKASEEYFTGQLPGLEEQVVKVAESAARRVGGGGEARVDEYAELRDRLDNIERDPQFKAMVAKLISEQGPIFYGTAAHANQGYETQNKGSSIGRLFKWLIILAILVAVAYWALVIFMPGHPVTDAVVGLLGPLIEQITSWMSR